MFFKLIICVSLLTIIDCRTLQNIRNRRSPQSDETPSTSEAEISTEPTSTTQQPLINLEIRSSFQQTSPASSELNSSYPASIESHNDNATSNGQIDSVQSDFSISNITDVPAPGTRPQEGFVYPPPTSEDNLGSEDSKEAVSGDDEHTNPGEMILHQSALESGNPDEEVVKEKEEQAIDSLTTKEMQTSGTFVSTSSNGEGIQTIITHKNPVTGAIVQTIYAGTVAVSPSTEFPPSGELTSSSIVEDEQKTQFQTFTGYPLAEEVTKTTNQPENLLEGDSSASSSAVTPSTEAEQGSDSMVSLGEPLTSNSTGDETEPQMTLAARLNENNNASQAPEDSTSGDSISSNFDDGETILGPLNETSNSGQDSSTILGNLDNLSDGEVITSPPVDLSIDDVRIGGKRKGTLNEQPFLSSENKMDEQQPREDESETKIDEGNVTKPTSDENDAETMLMSQSPEIELELNQAEQLQAPVTLENVSEETPRGGLPDNSDEGVTPIKVDSTEKTLIGVYPPAKPLLKITINEQQPPSADSVGNLFMKTKSSNVVRREAVLPLSNLVPSNLHTFGRTSFIPIYFNPYVPRYIVYLRREYYY